MLRWFFLDGFPAFLQRTREREWFLLQQRIFLVEPGCIRMSRFKIDRQVGW